MKPRGAKIVKVVKGIYEGVGGRSGWVTLPFI